MRDPRMLKATTLALLALSASIGYWRYLELYGIEETETRMMEKSYSKRVFAKAGGAGMLSRVYRGSVTVSLAASEPVRVEFMEAVMRNGAQYRMVESHIVDHMVNVTFEGPQYVAVEVGILEGCDEVTVWSMRIAGPVEETHRPHEGLAITLGYISVVTWLFVGSLVSLEVVWRIYQRLGAGSGEGSGGPA
jgi:hypothetical protein